MLKRMVRNLVGHGRLLQVISEQRYVKAPRVDTDSDHAGCVLTRKSTTCAHLFHGVNLIKVGSWTQGTRSLSVAEAEFFFLANTLHSVSLVQTAVQPRVSWRDV